MTRAAIFIGVNKTGDLPVLQDAASGARRLHDEWAHHQKLGPAILITDERNAVTADDIQKAIEDILEPDNVEQLFVYFAGHGVNVRMGEYWLLSDAPKRTQAAVNVRGSEFLARYSGVPHVVFISDACRTAADTINAQNVTGTDIFPNEQLTDTEKPVDLFYSCALGKPAHEARDVNVTASQFKALYTAALTKALCFQEAEVVDWVKEEGADVGYIRPRRLRDFLKTAVSKQIRDLSLQNTVIQVSDAHISSEPDAWLSRLTRQVPPPKTHDRRPRGDGLLRGGLASRAMSSKDSGFGPIPDGRTVSQSLVSMAIRDPRLVSDAIVVVASAGPQHFETQCGFKIRGARIAESFAIGATLERLGPSRELVRVKGASRAGASTLLVMDNGTGIVLPAIPEFIASLTMEEGDLIDVAYEPSDNTQRGEEYRNYSKELRTLRKVISSASLTGSFRLDGGEALSLAQRLQSLKGTDPSLAVYAAYAYNDLHRQDLLQRMNGYMKDDLGASLFDVGMLAGALDAKKLSQRPPVLGFAPLLSQGWAYLRARRIALPEGCDALPRMLTQSLWTMFNPDGVSRLRETIFLGAQPWQII
jgi:Caspase domain